MKAQSRPTLVVHEPNKTIWSFQGLREIDLCYRKIGIFDLFKVIAIQILFCFFDYGDFS
jgi:hypothetical protein